MIEYVIIITITVLATLYCTNAKVRNTVHTLISHIKNARKDSEKNDPPDGPPTGAVPVGA